MRPSVTWLSGPGGGADLHELARILLAVLPAEDGRRLADTGLVGKRPEGARQLCGPRLPETVEVAALVVALNILVRVDGEGDIGEPASGIAACIKDRQELSLHPCGGSVAIEIGNVAIGVVEQPDA